MIDTSSMNMMTALQANSPKKRRSAEVCTGVRAMGVSSTNGSTIASATAVMRSPWAAATSARPCPPRS